jgi:hypothetical protein
MKVLLAFTKASDPRREKRYGQPPRVAQMQGRRERQVLKGKKAPIGVIGAFSFFYGLLSSAHVDATVCILGVRLEGGQTVRGLGDRAI